MLQGVTNIRFIVSIKWITLNYVFLDLRAQSIDRWLVVVWQASAK